MADVTKKDIQDLQKQIDDLTAWKAAATKGADENFKPLWKSVHDLTKAVNDLLARVAKLES